MRVLKVLNKGDSVTWIPARLRSATLPLCDRLQLVSGCQEADGPSLMIWPSFGTMWAFGIALTRTEERLQTYVDTVMGGTWLYLLLRVSSQTFSMRPHPLYILYLL